MGSPFLIFKKWGLLYLFYLYVSHHFNYALASDKEIAYLCKRNGKPLQGNYTSFVTIALNASLRNYGKRQIIN